MAFTLGQMFGGWKKKGGDAKNAPKFRGTSSEISRRGREPAPSSTLGVESQKTPSVFPGAGGINAQKHQSNLAWELIRSPHISEKATMLGEGKYVLKVSGISTKGQLHRAVEDRYGVKVDSVRVLNVPSKKRRRGATIGTKSGYKKAIISLKAGQTISEF